MKKTKQNVENREETRKEENRTSNRVGALLKKRREEKKLSLKKVSKHLCIREAFLSAIEEGTKKDLPERVYALGFVRSYAHYLDLDENAVLNEYTREYKETDLHPHYVFPEPVPQKGVPTFLNYGVGFLILILGLALWIFFKNPFMSDNEPIEDQEIVIERPTLEEPIPTTDSNIPSPIENPLPIPLTDSSLSSDSSSDFSTSLTPEEEEVPPSGDILATASSESSSPTSLHLHAKEKVWVQVNDHTETPLLTKTMHPGESYTLPYSDDLLLTVGNAGGLQVFIDDIELPPLGQSGQVKRNISLMDRKIS